MPELPEVETIRRDLVGPLVGHSVSHLEVRDPRLVAPRGAALLERSLCGQKWQAIERKGKYLDVLLADGSHLIFHLRMTGQLVLRSWKAAQQGGILEKPLGSPYRMLLQFDHGFSLAFFDQRRFGEVFYLRPGRPWPGEKALGPDALNGLSREDFIARLKSKTTRVKPLLMDQHFLAGIGNIYAQEALFRAGIRPTRRAHRLTRSEADRLYDALHVTLLGAIKHRGSTSRNYRDALGHRGSAQDLHAVYRKGGQPCLRCGTTLRAIRLGGRGTVYCPVCQH
jgi:formamidopyrimidine-DNA glycosylase